MRPSILFQLESNRFICRSKINNEKYLNYGSPAAHQINSVDDDVNPCVLNIGNLFAYNMYFMLIYIAIWKLVYRSQSTTGNERANVTRSDADDDMGAQPRSGRTTRKTTEEEEQTIVQLDRLRLDI